MNQITKNRITILGTGTSTGVPTIGCQCAVCKSQNPKNKRFRTSIYIETTRGNKILVDATPDLRSQILQNNIDHIDFSIITHDHADHVHGIDDLRPFTYFQNKTMPIFTNEFFAQNLTSRFPYIFQADKIYSEDRPPLGGGIPKLELKIIQPNQQCDLNGERFEFLELPHGYGKSLGFIHESFAYLIDCHEIPEEVLMKLEAKKLQLIIIDCLKRAEHKTHLNLEKSLKYVERINAQFSGLIHMAHDFDHNEFENEMTQKYGKKVSPLFDTQKLEYPSL